MEAIGGLEISLAAALSDIGISVAVVNPCQIRDYARSMGKLVKTDKIDAQVMTDFASAVHPEPRPMSESQTQELKDLLKRGSQLNEMITTEKNRSYRARRPVSEHITAHVTWLEQELANMNSRLSRFIQESPIWRDKDNLLQTDALFHSIKYLDVVGFDVRFDIHVPARNYTNSQVLFQVEFDSPPSPPETQTGLWTKD
jgi:transposase